jgi:riboflavin-specific deaminase-like protein
VLVGIGTVLKDDPMLTVRHVKGRDPLRVVVDSRLRTPLTAKLLLAAGSGGTLLFTGSEPKPAVVRRFEDLGAEVVRVPHEHGTGVDLASVLSELGHRGVKSVLVEGGAKIVTSFLKSRLAHRMVIIIAPKIIGDGREAIGDLEITRLRDAIRLTSCSVRRLGSDVVIDGKLN